MSNLKTKLRAFYSRLTVSHPQIRFELIQGFADYFGGLDDLQWRVCNAGPGRTSIWLLGIDICWAKEYHSTVYFEGWVSCSGYPNKYPDSIWKHDWQFLPWLMEPGFTLKFDIHDVYLDKEQSPILPLSNCTEVTVRIRMCDTFGRLENFIFNLPIRLSRFSADS